jgi:hypothetical protein
MKRWTLAPAVTAILAALALLTLAGACTDEEDLPEDTQTPQHTEATTATPRQTATAISTPTPEPMLTSEPTKGIPTEVAQEPAETPEITATPEAAPTPEETQTPEATPTTQETQVPTPAPMLPEVLKSEIRSVIPSTGAPGSHSASEFRDYVNQHSPITTTHLLMKIESAPVHAPHFIQIRITKEDGWHEGELGMYRDWRDAVLRELVELRNLAGLQCKVIIFEIPPVDSMTVSRGDRQLICPEPEAPESAPIETLRSEIRSIIPPTDLAGLDSYKELEEYVSDHFPIITEHYLLQGAAGIPEDPALPIEVQLYKPGGWHEEDKDTYRDWQEVTLEEIARIRNLSGYDCTYFLFATPDSPDTITFDGTALVRRIHCP